MLLAALCAALAASDVPTAGPGAPAVGTLTALLCAVCAAGLGEWLIGVYPASGHTAVVTGKSADMRAMSRLPVAAMPGALLSLCALVFVPFEAMLPVVAFDSAKAAEAPSHSAVSRASLSSPSLPVIITIVMRLAWLMPLGWHAFRARDEISELASLAILALLCAVAWAWGASFGREERLLAALRQAQDSRRGTVRDLKAQIDDSQEAQLSAVHEARLSERTRIARDIHDNVGHLLTRAIMQTEAARVVAEARADGPAADGFAQVSATVNEAMTMVRRSVHDLDDAGQDFADLIRAASLGNGHDGPEVTLRNTIQQAPAVVGRCFAAIIREALTNATRHGHAAHATVSAQDFPAFWQLVIQDDGATANDTQAGLATAGTRIPHDFSADAFALDARVMGLADIDARVAAMGGVSTHGPHGSGWRVFVSIPKSRFGASFDTSSMPADD